MVAPILKTPNARRREKIKREERVRTRREREREREIERPTPHKCRNARAVLVPDDGGRQGGREGGGGGREREREKRARKSEAGRPAAIEDSLTALVVFESFSWLL